MDFKIKIIAKNLIWGFLVGFFGAMGTIAIFGGQGFNELKDWLIALMLAGVAGGISGIIKAGQKYFSWKTDEEMLAEIEARINK